MECLICSDSLTAFIDGELGRDEAKEVEGHIAECTPCSEEHQSLLTSYRLVEQVSLLELDPDLWTRIESKITDVPTQKATWTFDIRSLFGVRWIPIAAGTLGVAFLSLLFLSAPDTETQQAFNEYLQQREQSERSRVSVSQDASSLELRVAYPNPFVVDDRSPGGNPFKLE